MTCYTSTADASKKATTTSTPSSASTQSPDATTKSAQAKSTDTGKISGAMPAPNIILSGAGIDGHCSHSVPSAQPSPISQTLASARGKKSPTDKTNATGTAGGTGTSSVTPAPSSGTTPGPTETSSGVASALSSISGSLEYGNSQGLFQSSVGRDLILALGLTQYRIDKPDNGHYTVDFKDSDLLWDNKFATTFTLTEKDLGPVKFGLLIDNSPNRNGCVDFTVIRLGTRDQGVTHYCPTHYYIFDDQANPKNPPLQAQLTQALSFYQQPERTVLVWGSQGMKRGWVKKHHLLIDLFDADFGFDANRCPSPTSAQPSTENQASDRSTKASHAPKATPASTKTAAKLKPIPARNRTADASKNKTTTSTFYYCTTKIARIDHSVRFIDRLVSERNF
jgi:hypothetical protein